MNFRFRCATCDQWHEGLPAFGAPAPDTWHQIAPGERAARGRLDSDACVLDDTYFYVCALLKLPIQTVEATFDWLVWCRVDAEGFARFKATFRMGRRAQTPPIFCFLDNELPFYRGSRTLGGHLHLRDNFQRPLALLDDSRHPLAIDQRYGITRQEAGTMAARLLHPTTPIG